MKFFVDANLPKILATVLIEMGYKAKNVFDLPLAQDTSDAEIAKFCDDNDFVLVTKDKDFYYSHLLKNEPKKLILVSYGNIKNRPILSVFRKELSQYIEILQTYNMIEISSGGIKAH